MANPIQFNEPKAADILDVHIQVDKAVARNTKNSKGQNVRQRGCCDQISRQVSKTLNMFVMALMIFFGGVLGVKGAMGLSIGIGIALCIKGLILLLLLPLKIIQIMIDTCCCGHSQARHKEKAYQEPKKSRIDLEFTSLINSRK